MERVSVLAVGLVVAMVSVLALETMPLDRKNPIAAKHLWCNTKWYFHCQDCGNSYDCPIQILGNAMVSWNVHVDFDLSTSGKPYRRE
jgi:hypothetical protein